MFREVVRTKVFEKHYAQLTKTKGYLDQDLMLAIEELSEDAYKYKPHLDNHPLKRPMAPYWSCKLGARADDCVVIFKITSNKVILHDIGSHAQVYDSAGTL